MSGLVIFHKTRVLPSQGLDNFRPVVRLQPTKGVRFRTVVRVEDAHERGQPRRAYGKLAQDARLLVPGQHVTARSGRGDGRGRAASTAGPQGVQKLTAGRSPGKKSADAVIASVSMRSQSTLAPESHKSRFTAKTTPGASYVV